MKTLLSIVALGSLAHMSLFGAETDPAAFAVNALGLDLHLRLASREPNLCLSPYSIQNAFVMTFAGAAGETKSEMAKVLHYSKPESVMHNSFAALRTGLETAQSKSDKVSEDSKKYGGPAEPITWNLANRIFGQKGYDFRPAYLSLLQERYSAPLETLDFQKGPAAATSYINAWVEEQTKTRIRDLIPPGAIKEITRLVLANAIYLKAPWAKEFSDRATEPKPFHLLDGKTKNVPMMVRQDQFGYAKYEGFAAVSLPYSGGDLQFLVLLPDDPTGLAGLEAKLTPALLSECGRLPVKDVILQLPKFKLEPPTMALAGELQALGMKTAFDQPQGSANFDGMAPRKPDDYLYISEVFHKTFLAVDEKGTEAAAATAIVMAVGAAMIEKPKPIEVTVDRPFVFAIQHGPSGACLFLGRLSDPK